MAHTPPSCLILFVFYYSAIECSIIYQDSYSKAIALFPSLLQPVAQNTSHLMDLMKWIARNKLLVPNPQALSAPPLLNQYQGAGTPRETAGYGRQAPSVSR
jgi:hypothetical protein